MVLTTSPPSHPFPEAKHDRGYCTLSSRVSSPRDSTQSRSFITSAVATAQHDPHFPGRAPFQSESRTSERVARVERRRRRRTRDPPAANGDASTTDSSSETPARVTERPSEGTERRRPGADANSDSGGARDRVAGVMPFSAPRDAHARRVAATPPPRAREPGFRDAARSPRRRSPRRSPGRLRLRPRGCVMVHPRACLGALGGARDHSGVLVGPLRVLSQDGEDGCSEPGQSAGSSFSSSATSAFCRK